jgi:hypothetical protein
VGACARVLAWVAAAVLAGSAWSQQAGPLEAAQMEVLELRPAQAGEAVLTVHAVHFAGGGWERPALEEAFRESAAILAQCGVRLARVNFALLDAPRRYHYYHTPVSREFARRAAFPRPTVFFVRDTLNRPAFDAEAIGRANSRLRPELTNTIWMALGVRDPGIALAHELTHLLMDSGEHLELPGNLMRSDTSPENTHLDAAQCERIVRAGREGGLLQ